ncbi:expressed unknown protein [Seminavis robusta]|uniref:Uncharacterized protein n=1 Tax=Seminavis robusta TaxID=568900 RepID=A0A9N8HR58_9STRA|nr:expressed unknown protein [Seminavis robusta]|eukprot:Sro1528_g279950.1 n/a (536) ;mRNA; f:6968-8679
MVRVGSGGVRRNNVPSPRHFTFTTWHQHGGLFRRQTDIITALLGVSVVMLYSAYFMNLTGYPGQTTTYKKTPDHQKQPGSLANSNTIDDLRKDSKLSILPQNNTSADNTAKPVVIAHVVSLIKCAEATSVTGFLDAAAVLRHSIHKTSVHTIDPQTFQPVSKYSYQMYAIVHAENCANHARGLAGLGYTTLMRHNPVNRSDIINESYRHFVQYENCCGLDEFIKLYAYTLLDHPISVHWDMDVLVMQPLDELYDSMLYDKDSPQGQAARANLHLSYPLQPLPDRIDAFYTKDVTSSQPWEMRQGVQGGFLVARPSLEIFQKYKDFITEGDYIKGRGNGFGWGGLGFGGFQGAMAYQGATAYMYDIIYPGHAVPLNPCIYNQVVADVLWRGPHAMEFHMQCRQYPHEGYTFTNNTIEYSACQDCRITPVADTKTVHYTACKKPWECIDPKPRRPRDKAHVYRLENLTNRTTCHLLFAEWFRTRREFEQLLARAVEPATAEGQFLPDAFLGYCKKRWKYIPMVPPPEGFDVNSLYGM